MIDLDLHKYQENLKTKKVNSTAHIYDIIRCKYLVLQPEELVRQLIVHYLIEKGYPKEKIQVEKGMTINGLHRRFDIVVYDRAFVPYLLVECKSHKVPITQATFDQIARYNLEFKAPYLLVTNGVQTYCCEIGFQDGSIEYLHGVPQYAG